MTKLDVNIDLLARATERLQEVLKLEVNDIVRDSAIQRFEFTMDLAWKTIKSYLEEKKGLVCRSPKDCIKMAYQERLIEYDEYWLDLVDLRNLTSHSYNENLALDIYHKLPQALSHIETLLISIKKEATNN